MALQVQSLITNQRKAIRNVIAPKLHILMLFQFLLNDIKSTYAHDGGGGISDIKQTQTNVFVVSIAQEERIDQLTYQLSIDDSCKVALVKKEESAISFGR